MEEVTSELRSRAKAVNFGIVYGISDYGLSRDLNVTRKEAAQYIESYFDKCAGVKKFIDEVVEEAHQHGYVTTLFGRRRYLPDINSSNYNQRSFAERTAMNTPIQGSAADIIKKAMIDVYRELNKQNLRSRILLQVHDELLLEVVEEEIKIVTAILKEAMQQTVSLNVALTIDVNVGNNWAEAK
jgi:DNA polymerase-1